MKKTILLIFIFSLFAQISFSQNADLILKNAAKDLGLKLKKDINNNEDNIKQNIEYQDTINIQLALFPNLSGETTELSEKLSIELSFALQKELNNSTYKRANYYVYTKAPSLNNTKINEAIQEIPEYDYYLSGQYILSGNALQICHLLLIPNSKYSSAAEISLNDHETKNESFGTLAEMDSKLISTAIFQRFINFQKKGLLLKTAKIAQNETNLPSFQVPNLGMVYNVKYDTEYNINIELTVDAYVYVFHYDPYDMKYNFIWLIQPWDDSEEILLKKGNHKKLLKYPFTYTNTGNDTKYQYVKIIISKEKILLSKYVIRSYIDGYETPHIVESGCKLLIEYLQTNKVQTKTIITKFK